jgi:hypothetical protein
MKKRPYLRGQDNAFRESKCLPTTHAANARSREHRVLDHVVHPHHSFFTPFSHALPENGHNRFLNAGVVGVIEVTVA